jgi:hypothetical protein
MQNTPSDRFPARSCPALDSYVIAPPLDGSRRSDNPLGGWASVPVYRHHRRHQQVVSKHFLVQPTGKSTCPRPFHARSRAGPLEFRPRPLRGAFTLSAVFACRGPGPIFGNFFAAGGSAHHEAEKSLTFSGLSGGQVTRPAEWAVSCSPRRRTPGCVDMRQFLHVKASAGLCTAAKTPLQVTCRRASLHTGRTTDLIKHGRTLLQSGPTPAFSFAEWAHTHNLLRQSGPVRDLLAERAFTRASPCKAGPHPQTARVSVSSLTKRGALSKVDRFSCSARH